MIEGLNALDRSLFIFINAFHSTLLDGAMVFLSGQIIWAPFIGYFIWYCFKYFGKNETIYFCVFLVLTLVASDVSSSYLIKNLVNRLRPCRNEELKLFIYSFGQKCGGKFGFVSSHAANSFALISFSLSTLKFKQKWKHLMWIVPGLVSYSRIYLGVHYPGDILVGAMVGIGWAIFFSWVYRSRSRGKTEQLPISID